MIIRKFEDKDREEVLSLIEEVLYEIFKVKPKEIVLDKSLFEQDGFYILQNIKIKLQE